jgi:teichuronic acid biosynthesis glycosyltransferase TuaC
MRILTLSTVFPNLRQPAFGIFVAERMRRVARHCDVSVVAPVPWFPGNGRIRPHWAGVPATEGQEGFRVYHPRVLCVPRYAKWSDGLLYAASLLPFLTWLRRRFPFDLIDAHFAYPDGLAAALLGRIFRVPVIITLRGSIVRLRHYPLHRPQIRWALRRAARVLAVSQSLKQVAVGLGVSPEHIRVIPNGVDADVFVPREPAEARRALGLSLDATILLSVGGLNAGKGHHRVVAQIPELVRHFPDLLYVIVGGERAGDSSRGLIESVATRLGVSNRVRLVGERPHEEVANWLSAADLFCLATRSEGWANVLLESLACGTPVVSTRVGGNAEIVSHEGLGLLVPAQDDRALAAAIREGLTRRWDPQLLVAHAQAHSWNSAVRGVLDEFERVLAGDRQAGAPVSGLAEPGTKRPR